jgi:hypothetical protein
MKGDSKEAELYQRLDEIIHYLWDPIGVSGVPEAATNITPTCRNSSLF